VVSSTPRPHFTPGKEPVPILQEAGWAPGPVWTGGKSRPHREFFLLYLKLHCHYITIVGSLLDRLSSVTVRHIYFGLSKCTVFSVVIFVIGSLINLGQWLTGSCQRDFGPTCDSTASIEFGVGSPWNPVGSGLYDAEIRSRTFQPVVSRYTDWATWPTHGIITHMISEYNLELGRF